MRDLRVWIERGPQGSRAGLEIVPPLCAERGHVPTGVLALLIDVAGGDAAVRAARPGWVATSDLVLHLLRPVASGVVTAAPELLRTTRSTLVLEVTLRAGAGAGAGTDTQIGLATMTFARLAARGEVQRMGAGRDEARTEFGGPGAGWWRWRVWPPPRSRPAGAARATARCRASPCGSRRRRSP